MSYAWREQARKRKKRVCQVVDGKYPAFCKAAKYSSLKICWAARTCAIKALEAAGYKVTEDG